MQLPTHFIPHGGGPCFFMDWGLTGDPPDTWDRTAAWLRQLGGTLPARPEAIVVISGHWEQPVFTTGSAEAPALIFDYSGFPPHTYQLRYPAAGAPRLAQRVVELLGAAGLPARADPARGLDHGIFVPFLLIYPQADIPIVPLSLQQELDPQQHLAAGRALAALRAEGVWIVGSGMSYHNMRGFRTAAGAQSSESFDHWLAQTLAAGDPRDRWNRLAHGAGAPAARAAHPREEHLLPLMVAAGAAVESPAQQAFSDTVMQGARISGYRFG